MISRFVDPVLRWRRRVLWDLDKDTARRIEEASSVAGRWRSADHRIPRRMLTDPRVRLTLLPRVLSERELDVLIGAARGESLTVTADRLFITPNTVRRHRQRIIGRMGAENLVHAVALAVLARWITEKDLRGE